MSSAVWLVGVVREERSGAPPGSVARLVVVGSEVVVVWGLPFD